MTTVQDAILAELRKRIVEGEVLPGERLPDRRSLAQSFQASPVTVQAAMRRLEDEGFVTVGARKRGTLVADRPPHLCRYVLLFPHRPETRGEFWRALQREAARMTETSQRDVSCFYGLGGQRDIRAYQELVDDVRAERVAGLIFASGGAEFRGTPVLEQPGIPRVGIGDRHELAGIPKLHVDHASFFALALARLVSEGRRRMAVVFGASPGDDESRIARTWAAAMRRRKLPIEPVWVQFADVWSPMSARRCVHLLFRRQQKTRPDGLIVADDNLLEAATHGLIDAGVDVPGEVGVVSLANFPSEVPAAVPVTRIGFDVRVMLERLAGMVEALRQAKRVPELTRVQAKHEPEQALSGSDRKHAKITNCRSDPDGVRREG